MEPPPNFEVYDFEGLPPPPPAEYVIIDSPVIIFDPVIYPPPPPPPVYFLPPQPIAFIELPPPPPPEGPGFLPISIRVPVPFGRYNGSQGVVVQQNFGQQGSVGRGAAPGAAQTGQPGAPPAPPAAANPAVPNHALPQGAGWGSRSAERPPARSSCARRAAGGFLS